MDPITIIVGVVTLLVGAVITFFVLKNTDLIPKPPKVHRAIVNHP